MSKKLLAAAAGVTLIAMALIAASALAGVVKVNSKVTARAAPGAITGTVKSPAKPCRVNRKVIAFDFLNGRIVAFDRTDAKGRYSIALPAGDYDLRANRKQKIVSGRGVLCRIAEASLFDFSG